MAIEDTKIYGLTGEQLKNLPEQVKAHATTIAASAGATATSLADEHTDNKLKSYSKTADYADVAFSGSYNDLTNKPDISGSIDTVVNEESEARTSADAILQANIDAEAAARDSAVQNLQNSINSEATTRETADQTLQTNITNEASARETADTTLQTNITNEATARQTADTALQNSISDEASTRAETDASLQSQIDAISAASDVVDVVGTHADLADYDTSALKDKDIIKVLSDENEGGATAYYRWFTSTHVFMPIGTEGPYYTKGEADTLLAGKVDNSTFDTLSTTVTNQGTAISNLQTSKADASTVYTKTQVDTALNAKANSSDVYTKTQADTLLNAKADASTVYTKTEMDSALAGKAAAPASGTTYVTNTTLNTELNKKANTADLATVATSGKYSDLTGTPTIPTVNNATLTIQKNGSTVKTFTANSASNVTANITVPTKVSELTNDSAYAKSSDVDSKVADALTAVGEDYVSKSSIADDLETDSSTKVLSAKMGKVLNEGLAEVESELNDKSKVSFTRSLTSGTAVGTLNIDGTDTILYAPTNVNTQVTQTARTTNGQFPILLRGTSAGTSTTTTTTSFGAGITANPSTGKIAAGSGSVAFGDNCLVTGDTVYTALEAKPTITMQTTDPGEGATLAANNFIAVYTA